MYKQNIEKHIELTYPVEGVSVSRCVFFLNIFFYIPEWFNFHFCSGYTLTLWTSQFTWCLCGERQGWWFCLRIM